MAYRLSLPTRALSFDKIPKDKPNSKPPRFSTINLGKGLARRRANISSAFSNLWEKDENLNDGEFSSHTSAATPRWSATRIENIGVSHDSKHRRIYGFQQMTMETTDAITGNTPPRVPFIDHGFLRVGTPFSAGFQDFSSHASPKPESPNVVSLFDDQKRQLDLPPHRSLDPGVTNVSGFLDVQKSRLELAPPPSSDTGLLNLGVALHASKPRPVLKPQDDLSEEVVSYLDLNQTRSASSFYPSEGIQSDECISPALHSNRDRNFSLSSVSQYLMNSRKAWLRSTCRTDDSTGDRNIEFTLQEELAAAARLSDTGSVTTDDVNTQESEEHLGVPPNSPEGGNEGSPSVETATLARPIVDTQTVRSLRSISNSSSEINTAHRVSDVDSIAVLQSNTDSQDSDTTTVRGLGQCGPPPPRIQYLISHHDPISSPSTAESTPCGFHPLERQNRAEATSVTLVQRVRNLKLKKWVKKVCRTTKVRFRHVLNPRVGTEKMKDQPAKVTQKGGVKRILSGSRKARSGVRKPKKSKTSSMKHTEQLPRIVRQDIDFGKFGELFRVKRVDTAEVKGIDRYQGRETSSQ